MLNAILLATTLTIPAQAAPTILCQVSNAGFMGLETVSIEQGKRLDDGAFFGPKEYEAEVTLSGPRRLQVFQTTMGVNEMSTRLGPKDYIGIKLEDGTTIQLTEGFSNEFRSRDKNYDGRITIAKRDFTLNCD